MRLTLRFFLALCSPALPALAANPLATLVDDRVVEPTTVVSSAPTQFFQLGERTVFTAFHPLLGSEPWSTDGTFDGTAPLADSCPGCAPPFGNPLVPAVSQRGEHVYWLGGVPGALTRIWRSDGTREGTVPIELDGALPNSNGPLAVLNGRAIFDAFRADIGCELFVGENSGSTAELLTEVAVGPGCNQFRNFAVLGDRGVFIPEGAGAGNTLWGTDGTSSGTLPISSFDGEGLGPGPVALGAHAYFFESSIFGSRRLWRTDGTLAGTVAVRDFELDGHVRWPSSMAALGDRLFFVALDSNSRPQLWTSDGTTAKTRRLTNFDIPLAGGFDPWQRARDAGLTRVGERVYFLISPEFGRYELWGVNVAGGNLRQEATFPNHVLPTLFTTTTHAFYVTRDATGLALWSVDGSLQPPTRLHGFLEGNADIAQIAPLPGSPAAIVFVDRGADLRLRLFTSTGTVAGTRLLNRFPAGMNFGGYALAPQIGRSGEHLLVSVGDGVNGQELWSVDLASGSTRLLANLAPEEASSFPQSLRQLGERVVDMSRGAEGWTVTLSGGGSPMLEHALPFETCSPASRAVVHVVGSTVLIACDAARSVFGWRGDATPPALLSTSFQSPFGLITTASLNGTVYYLQGNSLWQVNADATAVTRVLETSDLAGSNLNEVYAFNGALLLVTRGPGLDGMATELWRCDGTLAGTSRIAAFPSLARIQPLSATRLLALVSPFAIPTSPNELWVTDGSAAGTTRLFDLTDIGISQTPSWFATGPGYALFLASDANFFPELWRTDGTVNGTFRLRANFLPPPLTSLSFAPPPVSAPLGNRLLFGGSELGAGETLWSTDGTAAGTAPVVAASTTGPSLGPDDLTAAGGKVYFSGNHPVLGRELWSTDGTTAGTKLVHDLAPGAFSSSPEGLAAAGGFLYLSAEDGLHGRELWALDLAHNGCVASSRALCLEDGRFRVETFWKDFHGRQGRGTTRALTADTGAFWFFQPDNLELMVKLLDGRGLNDHFWTFYGALSTVEYHVVVTDAETGVSRRYTNPSGTLASRADTASFGPNGASLEHYTAPEDVSDPTTAGLSESTPSAALAPRGSCAPASNRLCLRNGRFAVEASWRDFQGNTGTGTAIEITGDTGTFWFFRPENLEVILKVLDGTGLNGKHWVFYGALSSVEYTLTVTDSQTGAIKTYFNPLGRLASVADTGAF